MTGQDDLAVWAQYAQKVKKLPERGARLDESSVTEDRHSVAPAPKEEGSSNKPAARSAPEQKEAAEPTVSASTQRTNSPWKKEALDPSVERNLSLGDVMIEARLDLHGHTEQGAYEQFRDFVISQAARGRRLLLVITGRGGTEGSVLRQNLPRWCVVPPFEGVVLAVRTAAPHHGGDGAYYVLLRKQEKRSPA